jgi:hypothetical protein
MSKTAIDLFAEDRAHEELLKALIGRLSGEEGLDIVIRTRASRGGHGRALAGFELNQAAVEQGFPPLPDLLVVAVDANCQRYQEAQRELQGRLRPELRGRTALACPDPHVERWFMADPESFATVVGVEPPRERRKCQRDRYKRLLVDAIRNGGHVPILGGIEFARDLVLAMDLYRACRNEPSLRSFVDGARAVLRLAREC